MICIFWGKKIKISQIVFSILELQLNFEQFNFSWSEVISSFSSDCGK